MKDDLTWHHAIKFLLLHLPTIGADTEREDWPPEFADLVAMIVDGRGVDLSDLEELEINIARLRAAVAEAVSDEEAAAASEEG
jgi:hypothetical protein